MATERVCRYDAGKPASEPNLQLPIRSAVPKRHRELVQLSHVRIRFRVPDHWPKPVCTILVRDP
jgi:hypothetical protein